MIETNIDATFSKYILVDAALCHLEALSVIEPDAFSPNFCSIMWTKNTVWVKIRTEDIEPKLAN